MSPKKWRIKQGFTVRHLSALLGFKSPAYVSEVENEQKRASGALMLAYYNISDGEVTPNDFKKHIK